MAAGTRLKSAASPTPAAAQAAAARAQASSGAPTASASPSASLTSLRISPAVKPESKASERIQRGKFTSVAAERLSSYRGAQATRLDKPFPGARGASPDWTLEREYDRRDLVDRARQLERNSVLAEGMLSRSTEAVVGNGFGLQAKSADEVWNKDVEAKWKAWCESGADVRGLCSFGELLALVFRSFLRDGDVGAVLLSTGHIRVVESDEIASPTGYMRPNMVDGVELDEAGRPIAYHVIRNPRMLAVDREVAAEKGQMIHK